MSQQDNGQCLSRRDFFKVSATTGGALLIAVQLPGCASLPAGQAENALRPNAWLEVTPDNQVILTLDRVEMGQGTMTGMATLLGEELHVSPDRIKVVFAPVAEDYRQPDYGLQITGGSTSISSNWVRLREAGAAGRMMIEAAAAQLWQVPVTRVQAIDGVCQVAGNAAVLSYGELASLAALQRVPSSPALTAPENYRYIGKQSKRLDAQAKSFGQARFGIDVQLPGMRYAVLSRPPVAGGKVKRVDRARAQAAPGVVKVIETACGVAVVAEQYWQARKAQRLLDIEWDHGELAQISTDQVFDCYARALNDGASDVRDEGDFEAARVTADRTLKVEYRAPFLAHATLEPQNCTVHITKDKCEIWAPTQGPDIARAVARRETGFSSDQIQVHTTYIGGGFGRRLTQDFVAEAVAIARHLDTPVKLIWSREEDTRHDHYRPASLHRLEATFNAEGKVTGWRHDIAAPRILDHFVGDAAGAVAPGWTPQPMVRLAAGLAKLTQPDPSPVEGAQDLPYEIANLNVRYAKADAGIPISYWRSVGHSTNGFVTESFVDELAHAEGKDPVAYRLALLPATSRLRTVLIAATETAGWRQSLSEGRFQGVACHKSFGSYAAQVIEVSVVDGDIKIHRVVCAIDCGQVVNPDLVVAQMQSGIIFGLSAALYGNITHKEGQVEQSNFHDQPILRMPQTPRIEVVIVKSQISPTGVGEPGVPPVAPALANALFSATGQRLRSLPLVLA
ncbi:MAG: xanthine dehydrogenase family protein molybdopterin-binding subunit [Hahellaceae bacterium]|nr:xanthine dehydrogenase family protein molybdopterin-binding subunit [Hahellaceae bacterium]